MSPTRLLGTVLLIAAPSVAQNPWGDACEPLQPPPRWQPGPSVLVGAARFPGQELYVNDLVGNVYRIDDYATAPTAAWLAHTGVGRVADIAWDPHGTLFSCHLDVFPITEFYRHDAGFTAALVGAALTMDWANALDIDAHGTMWARSANSPGLWTVDPQTGAESLVTIMPAATAGDLAVDRDGSLLALDEFGGIDRCDPLTGAVSVLGPHGLGSQAWGFEIDLDGTGYVFVNNGDLYALDTTTLATTFLGSTGIHVAGCAFRLSADSKNSIGQRYCDPAQANSTGAAATLEAIGSASISDDDLTLVARNLPANTRGLFLRSPVRGYAPLLRGQGTLCLAPPISFLSPLPVDASSVGTACLALDLSQLASAIGDTQRFQFWYRDANPTPTTNFTDAIAVTFE